MIRRDGTLERFPGHTSRFGDKDEDLIQRLFPLIYFSTVDFDCCTTFLVKLNRRAVFTLASLWERYRRKYDG